MLHELLLVIGRDWGSLCHQSSDHDCTEVQKIIDFSTPKLSSYDQNRRLGMAPNVAGDGPQGRPAHSAVRIGS